MNEEAAFLGPVHQDESDESEENDTGVDMNIEACEVKHIDIVDLRNSKLKLRILEQLIELLLIHRQLLD